VIAGMACCRRVPAWNDAYEGARGWINRVYRVELLSLLSRERLNAAVSRTHDASVVTEGWKHHGGAELPAVLSSSPNRAASCLSVGSHERGADSIQTAPVS